MWLMSKCMCHCIVVLTCKYSTTCGPSVLLTAPAVVCSTPDSAGAGACMIVFCKHMCCVYICVGVCMCVVFVCVRVSMLGVVCMCVHSVHIA